MGCNAWNHPSDCNCGWGGDTGGGRGSVGAASPVRHVKIPDGLDWLREQAPAFETYINPNARCPVCGANVFFYQSPFGGRVFFDELGPPWPKHPCTDTYVSTNQLDPILPPLKYKISTLTPYSNPRLWAPLIFLRIVNYRESFDLFLVNRRLMGIPGFILPLPSGIFRDVPIFWRRSAADPSMLEFSAISADSGKLGMEIKGIAPSYISSIKELASFIEKAPLSAKILNRIGWMLSFQWCDLKNPKRNKVEYIDWQAAREYFERSADMGFGAARNNLGVIYREGLGVEPNLELSFAHFELAAQELNPVSLRHLARCYRFGLGVEPDSHQAEYLEELAALQESESR